MQHHDKAQYLEANLQVIKCLETALLEYGRIWDSMSPPCWNIVAQDTARAARDIARNWARASGGIGNSFGSPDQQVLADALKAAQQTASATVHASAAVAQLAAPKHTTPTQAGLALITQAVRAAADAGSHVLRTSAHWAPSDSAANQRPVDWQQATQETARRLDEWAKTPLNPELQPSSPQRP